MTSQLPPQALALRRVGVKDESIHWLGKSLHPPSDLPACAIPDRTVASSLFPEYRETAVISKPPGVTDTWDLLVIKPPGNVLGAVYLSGASGIDFRNPANVEDCWTGAAGFGAGRVTIQPTEATPSTPMTGIEFGASITPATDYPVCTLYPTARPMAWRKVATSLTCYLTASAIADQGTVYATQVSRRYKPQECRVGARSHGSESSGPYPLYRACPVSLPANEDEMMAADPKVYMAPARAGVYVPLKPFGEMDWKVPLQSEGLPFTPHGTTAVYYPTGPASATVTPAMECTAHPLGKQINPLTGQWEPIFWFGLPDDLDYETDPLDSAYDEWNTAVVLFRGLSADASVTLRIVDVIQQMPASASVYRPFVKPPPLYEPRALELYYRVAEATPNAYPANYNSWGKIWDVIKKVARDVVPIAEAVLPGVVAAVTESPEAAMTTSKVIGTVGTLVGAPGASGARVVYRAPAAPHPGPKKPGAKRSRRH